MKKDLFVTRFKKGHSWDIFEVLNIINRLKDEYNLVTVRETKCDNTIMVLECTDDAYAVFTKVIGKAYPGLCDFDI